jgi:hypothetical protein
MPEEMISGNAEVADPQDATETTPEAAGDVSTGEPEAQPVAEKQSKEKDATYADARRKEEIESLRSELKSRDKWVAEEFGPSHGIYTWAQYQGAIEASKNQQASAEQQKVLEGLKEQGVDVDTILKVVEHHPALRALQAENSMLKNRVEQQSLTTQFNELKAKFPDMKKPEDIDQETWTVYGAAQDKLTLAQAYYAVHGDELLSKAEQGGERKAIQKIGSKDHLTTEKSSGGGFEEPIPISDEKLDIYQKVLGYDAKQARKVEQKYMKMQKAKGG